MHQQNRVKNPQLRWTSNISVLPRTNQSIENEMHGLLQSILSGRNLNAVFQPIVHLAKNSIHGHEGLIRGPGHSALHSPIELFKVAEHYKLTFEMEQLSHQIVLESFTAHKSPYKLFVNISPDSLLKLHANEKDSLAYLRQLNLEPANVVLELTESSRTFDYQLLRRTTDYYRGLGFEIAIDDLGEGFSSLRLWSELRPDYVKIDKHFISELEVNPVKLEFVRSIQQIAENSGSKLIAEGIETQAQLSILKELGISYGQGYFLGRPETSPLQNLNADVALFLNKKLITVHSSHQSGIHKTNSLEKLVCKTSPISPRATVDEIYTIFEKEPNIYSLPVVDDGIPLGLISRYTISDQLSRQYARELYGKKSCTIFMDNKALIVEKNMSLQAISNLITNMEPHHLTNGFIVTENGRYIGVSSGHALLREITEMQIIAARYSNPLTLLPGNVPISEHIDHLLENDVTWWACYCDLDNFKPFNDMYGFRRGDEVIQFTGKLLQSNVESIIDFVGHIGGDDFIILFQSEDWETRCHNILDQLSKSMPDFYDEKDRLHGGISSKDRQGNEVFSPLVSMSIGVVKVDNFSYSTHHDVSSAIAKAKKLAKATPGNSLFIERRLTTS